MGYSWHDFLGILGVTMIVFSYFLLQSKRLRSDQLSYSIANAFGASLVIVSLLYEFNISAFLVEFFWLIISLMGVFRHITFSKKRER